MKKIVLFIVLFISLKAISQITYYDAMILREGIRWRYTWKIAYEPGITGVPTTSEESLTPYSNGYIKGDTIKYGKKIKYLKYGEPDICFTSDIKKFEIIKSILRYYSNYAKDTNFDNIKKEYISNNFIYPYILNSHGFTSGGISALPLIQSTITSFGGINVTNFADGLSKFMIDRFKTELSAAFFNKFKDELNNKDHLELQILFPETRKTLNTIDKDIYLYSNYLNTLRESFIKDMTNQYVNIQNLLNQQKYKNYFKNERPELGSILYTSLYFVNELSSGKHPGAVLANFNSKDKIHLRETDVQDNIRGAIQTVQLISESFKSKYKLNYWVTPDSVQDLVADPIAFKIYLGLIYQQAKLEDITFQKGKTLTSFLDTVAINYDQKSDSIKKYENFIESFIDKTQEVNEYITDLKAKKKSDIDYNDYYKLFNASLDLLEHSSTFIDLPYIDLGNEVENKIKKSVGTVLYTARSTSDLYIDVRTKNYSSAIMNTLSIIDTLLVQYTVNGEIRHGILKYGSFIASAAQAQNSNDVQNVIESAALPAGSYSIKQKTNGSIFINGYLGYALDASNYSIYMKGLYAPVGLSINCSVGKKRGGGAFTLFGSIIDVGGLAAYRFNNSTDTLKQEIKLQSIISPSMQVLYEFPKWPVNLCIGWRMTPSLFYSGDKTFTTIKSKSVFNVSLLVDIPFITIKTW